MDGVAKADGKTVERLGWYRKTCKLLFTLPGHTIKNYYCFRRMKKCLEKGNVLRATHLKSLMAFIAVEDKDIATAVTLTFIHEILTDYRENRAFFLLFNTDYALDNCIEDLQKLGRKLSSQVIREDVKKFMIDIEL